MEDNNPAEMMMEEMAPAAMEEPVPAAAAAEPVEDEKKSLINKSEHAETETGDEFDEGEYCPCCCCLCACSTKETRDLTCFGCFPIRFAIFAIAISTLLISLFLFIEIFILFMSPNIHWWYCVVAVVLLTPLIIGSVFLFGFFCKDDDSSRGKLDTACYMSIISFVLLTSWNIAYFIALYKGGDVIQMGSDEYVFWETSKKQYLVWNIFLCSVASFFYGYYVCVTRRYWYRLHKKEDTENADMMADMEAAGDDAAGKKMD
jgi:hypothetical protein